MTVKKGQLSKAGVFAVTMISHPTEGIIISGEEEMAKLTMTLLETSSMGRLMTERPTRVGGVTNHVSTRSEKEKALKEKFACTLPPLPMPFSEMKTFELLIRQLAKVWEVEMHGSKFKVQTFVSKKDNDILTS